MNEFLQQIEEWRTAVHHLLHIVVISGKITFEGLLSQFLICEDEEDYCLKLSKAIKASKWKQICQNKANCCHLFEVKSSF